MVKAVSGDLNDIRMIQSSSGIHSYEPSANDIAAIYDADVFCLSFSYPRVLGG